MFSVRNILALVLTVWFSVTTAWACKLAAAAYDLRKYLAAPATGQVVFIGRVASVVNVMPEAGLLSDQHIEFTALRWWRGKSRPNVAARGIVAKPIGTDCDGTWDFSVTAGDEWLIVGYEKDGVVRPSALLSERLKDGKLPDELISILNSK